MKAPIFIYVENSYLDIYGNLSAAECALEAVDVADGLYRGFNANGCLLRIEPYKGCAKITMAELKPTHCTELAQLIKEFIMQVRPDTKVTDDLPHLVNLVRDLARY